jgi:hypothetical protein
MWHSWVERLKQKSKVERGWEVGGVGRGWVGGGVMLREQRGKRVTFVLHYQELGSTAGVMYV